MVEFSNRASYGMNHTLVKYIEEESEWNYIPNRAQTFHLWVKTDGWIKQKCNNHSQVFGIRYLYESKLNKLSYFHSLDSDLNQNFIASSLKYIAIVFHISNIFLRKNVWKLFDFFMTFSSQLWRMNYISEHFSNVLWNSLKTLLGCPFGSTCLQPVDKYWNRARKS